jgi:Domain of unknown function (DUF4214)
MLRGFLDAVTSSGHVEGWAYDTASPLRPLTVGILNDRGVELGWCTASRYRDDLATANCAAGWCAFRIRLGQPFRCVAGEGMTLIERHSGKHIIRRCPMSYISLNEAPIDNIADLMASDPTCISSLAQLRGCNELFGTIIKTRGIVEFVRTAYLYVLSRSADPSGLKAYAKHYESNSMLPHELLIILADSDEYRSKARRHCIPTNPAFPFRLP